MAKVNQIGKVPLMGKKFWKAIGEKIGGIGGWVYKDCEKGLMQNNTQKHALSPGYKKYKDKDMRRLDGKRLGDTVSLKSGGTKTLKTRKFPVVGRSLYTIGKPYVTMLLTGDTIRGLRGTKVTKNSILMKFNPRDTPKIVGNKKRMYDVTGLNTKNIRLIKAEMIKQFKKNKVKFIKKNITINIGG